MRRNIPSAVSPNRGQVHEAAWTFGIEGQDANEEAACAVAVMLLPVMRGNSRTTYGAAQCLSQRRDELSKSARQEKQQIGSVAEQFGSSGGGQYLCGGLALAIPVRPLMENQVSCTRRA